MKIATWNLERPIKTSKRSNLLTDCLLNIDADILILTESNEAIHLGDNYNYFHTEILTDPFYKEGERRTSIYSKYPVIEQFCTFRADTSLCLRLRTPFGDLTVYGTVIGIYGNRRKDFEEDLARQLIDFRNIAPQGSFCIGGDLNMSFGDNYYFTEQGRAKLNTSFKYLQLNNLTETIPNNIDHIIISKEFIKDKKVTRSTWNNEKKISDHIGVCVTIE